MAECCGEFRLCLLAQDSISSPVGKGLFGKNGTVPLGDRFCCENDLSSVLKRKEKVNLYDMGERNGTFASKQTLIDKST